MHICGYRNGSSYPDRQVGILVMPKLAALLAGIVFGAGLVVSGMTNPDKVQAFLTLNSNWDVSLIFVMGSALITAAVGYALSRTRKAPLFASTFHAPETTHIDRPLILGALLFGTGWAFSGYCPGPAIVGVFTIDTRASIFMVAYLAGVLLYQLGDQTGSVGPAYETTADG